MFDNARGVLASLLNEVRTFAPNLADKVSEAESVVGDALTAGKTATDALAAAQAQPSTQAAEKAVLVTAAGDAARLGEGGLTAFLATELAPVFGPSAPVVAGVFVQGGATAIADALKGV